MKGDDPFLLLPAVYEHKVVRCPALAYGKYTPLERENYGYGTWATMPGYNGQAHSYAECLQKKQADSPPHSIKKYRRLT